MPDTVPKFLHKLLGYSAAVCHKDSRIVERLRQVNLEDIAR